MKIKFLFLLFTLLAFVCRSQIKTQHVSIKKNATSQKIFVQVSDDAELVNNSDLHLINSKGKTVKTVKLSEIKKGSETSISIEDIEVGEYICTITKKDQEIYRTKFFKDPIDQY
jgi:hypothetical protein